MIGLIELRAARDDAAGDGSGAVLLRVVNDRLGPVIQGLARGSGTGDIKNRF